MKISSPGRVNLIGEHTDYSLGYVMPLAINLYTYLEGERYENVILHSRTIGEKGFFDPESFTREGNWLDYPKGIYFSLQKRGYMPGGLKGEIYGTLPIGAGLSSSASLELAILEFLNQEYNLNLSRMDEALIAKDAENEFVGVPCGIMDQMAIALGKRGTALFIDTENLEYEYIPFPKNLKILVFDTGVRRELSHSSYWERRNTVLSALEKLKKSSSKYVSLEDLEKLSEKEKIRMGYVIRENQRVLDAKDALRNYDWEMLGSLLLEAHWDLAENFGVSCDELDFFVKAAMKYGALGARLTGAGFGGSAIALFEDPEDVGEKIKREYERKFMHHAKYYMVVPSDGVGKCMD